IWKCAWCGIRKNKLTETEIKTLESFVRLFGWPVLPLTFSDDGCVYAYGQLSKMRKASAGVRWKVGGVSTVQAGNATNNVVRFPVESKRIVPDGARVARDTLRYLLEERGKILERVGQHPKFAILLRTDTPFRKIIRKFRDKSGGAHK